MNIKKYKLWGFTVILIEDFLFYILIWYYFESSTIMRNYLAFLFIFAFTKKNCWGE